MIVENLDMTREGILHFGSLVSNRCVAMLHCAKAWLDRHIIISHVIHKTCFVNKLRGNGGDKLCKTLNTSSARAFLRLQYIVVRLTLTSSSLYVDTRSLHTTLNIRLFNL